VITPPFSTKVKNGGAIPPLPVHCCGLVLNELSMENILPVFVRAGMVSLVTRL
jgi:hypothetical protein